MPGYGDGDACTTAPPRSALALTTNTGSGNRLSFYASGLHGLVDTILGRVLGWRE